MTPAVTKAGLPRRWLGTRFLPANKSDARKAACLRPAKRFSMVVEEAVLRARPQRCPGLSRVRSKKRSIEYHFDRNYDLEEALTAKEDVTSLALVL